jgi:hypothetical protein
MRILITTASLLSIAWIAHFIIWRIRLPRHQIRALLLIFTAVFCLWLAAFAPFSLSSSRLGAMQTALLYFSTAFCYVITYSAIEGDSPTLSLVRLLAEKKDGGLPVDEVAHFLRKRPFVQARLAALIHSGLVREENERFILAGRPSLAFRIVLGFRKLYGPISKGG